MAETRATQKVTIDGVEYAVDQLGEEARSQIVNLRVCEQEMVRLQQQLAIAQTARAAYASALKSVLPAPAAADKPAH